MYKIMIVMVILAVLLWPIKVHCGAPLYTCLTAPDERGYSEVSYVYEPLAVYGLERVFSTDISLEYYRGVDTIKVDGVDGSMFNDIEGNGD